MSGPAARHAQDADRQHDRDRRRSPRGSRHRQRRPPKRLVHARRPAPDDEHQRPPPGIATSAGGWSTRVSGVAICSTRGSSAIRPISVPSPVATTITLGAARHQRRRIRHARPVRQVRLFVDGLGTLCDRDRLPARRFVAVRSLDPTMQVGGHAIPGSSATRSPATRSARVDSHTGPVRMTVARSLICIRNELIARSTRLLHEADRRVGEHNPRDDAPVEPSPSRGATPRCRLDVHVAEWNWRSGRSNALARIARDLVRTVAIKAFRGLPPAYASVSSRDAASPATSRARRGPFS